MNKKTYLMLAILIDWICFFTSFVFYFSPNLKQENRIEVNDDARVSLIITFMSLYSSL